METNQQLEVLRTKYLSKELVEQLMAPTPREPEAGIVKWREGRGVGKVPYVEGTNFIRKLNDCFGFLWSFEAPQTVREGEQIVAKGRLTVHIPMLKKRIIKRYIEDGRQVEEESSEFEILNVVKEQSGSSEVKRWTSTAQMKDKKGNAQKDDKGNLLYKHKAGDIIDLGDDYKGAQTDAMKKCSTQLGVFLDVYEMRGEEIGEGEGKLRSDQLEVFYWRADDAGMTPEQADKWAEERLGTPKKDWDANDVMTLIVPLIDLKESKEKEG